MVSTSFHSSTALPADLAIEARWMLPMTGRGELLERHTLVLAHGRILDVLPSVEARRRYAPLALLERPAHLLLPGFVNAHTRIGSAYAPGLEPERTTAFSEDAALLRIAQMLSAGVTSFAHAGPFARDVARIAAEQGMRVRLGLPLGEPAETAASIAASLTEALALHDEYRSHPSIVTAFALLGLNALDDAVLARIATLSNEIDSGVLVAAHFSAAEIDQSVARHGLRPLARLERHGLLTPALAAAHMSRLEPAEIETARRGGIGIALCPDGRAPLGAFLEAGLRLGLGTAGALDAGLWTGIKLLALEARGRLDAAQVLAIAARGGAAVLGLESTGTLAPGDWGDLVCIDLARPAARVADDPLEALVAAGGRELVSDVLVAGRALICEGEFTRLDWPRLAARLDAAHAARRLDETNAPP